MAWWNGLFSLLLMVTILGGPGRLLAQEPATDAQPSVQAADAPPAAQPAADADLAAEVQQLRAQVDQLQSQVSRLSSIVEELQANRSEAEKTSVTARPSRKSPAGTTPSAAKKSTVTIAPTPGATAEATEEKTPLTVLVFQDGHRVEASNYAIIGQTLWIYTDQDSKKVPLAELDVNATKTANSDRGIVFQVPATK